MLSPPFYYSCDSGARSLPAVLGRLFRHTGRVCRHRHTVHEPVCRHNCKVCKIHLAIIVQVTCKCVQAWRLWDQKKGVLFALRIPSLSYDPAGVVYVVCNQQRPAAGRVYEGIEVDILPAPVLSNKVARQSPGPPRNLYA